MFLEGDEFASTDAPGARDTMADEKVTDFIPFTSQACRPADRRPMDTSLVALVSGLRNTIHGVGEQSDALLALSDSTS